MVTEEERNYLWHVYATHRRLRINLGIRRRLATLLNGDRRRIELMNSLLVLAERHPGDLLRRRDRHGRQPVSRRPRRGAHADAMVGRPQCRVLARRLCRSVPAADRAPALRLRHRQCRIAAQACALRCSTGCAGSSERAAVASRLRRAATSPFCGRPTPKMLAYLRHATTTRSSSASPICARRRRRRSSISPNGPAACRSRCSAAAAFRRSGDAPYTVTLPGHEFLWLKLFRADEVDPGARRAA